MQGTVAVTDRPCFICGKKDTLELKLKDKTFQGVVCWEHAQQILKRDHSKPMESTSKE